MLMVLLVWLVFGVLGPVQTDHCKLRILFQLKVEQKFGYRDSEKRYKILLNYSGNEAVS